MSTFQPHQIVYLEQGLSRLYAEAIQILPDRQLCWARPLVLIEKTAPEQESWDNLSELDSESIYLVVDGPDILWPLDQFQPALDTEVLPLLTLIQQDKAGSCDRSLNHERLQQFIRQFWQG